MKRAALNLLLAIAAGIGLPIQGCSRGAPSDPLVELPSPVEPAVGSGDADGSGSTAVAEPAPQAPPVEPETIEHVVSQNDTLWSLSHHYGISQGAIQRINRISDPNLIQRGARLRIPLTEPPLEPPAEAPSTEGGTEYVVQSGDSLEGIAVRFGCSQNEVMVANGMTNDALFSGRMLRIPLCAGAGSGEGSGSVDGAQEDATAEGSGSPGERPATYVVQPGEMLGAIASRFGCSVRQIADANGLNPNYIQAGQRLSIPVCEGDERLWEGIAEASAVVPAQPREVRSGSEPVGSVRRDGATLASMMQDLGFREPRRFKAYVIAVRFGRGRTVIAEEARFAYRNTSGDTSGWNPASAVKIYAAIAAMQYAEELGFNGSARLNFLGGRGEQAFTLDDLVQRALGPSDNIAYDYLVSFVGFDRMNGHLLTGRWGLGTSGLRRAYASSTWMDLGWSSSFASSPAVTITGGGRSQEIPARTATMESSCYAAACTSVEDLADAMRRLMLQEQLPADEGFGIDQRDLRVMRLALRSDRERGEEVVQALGESITGAGVRFYHKAGFAEDWFTDNVYVYDPDDTRAWVVTMTGYPGRSSLTNAGRIIGQLIAAGDLDP